MAHKVTPPVELRATDTLKLTFQIVDEDGKGVQPHQTFVRFYDEVTGEEGIQPIKVTSGGKAKLELVSALFYNIMRLETVEEAIEELGMDYMRGLAMQRQIGRAHV